MLISAFVIRIWGIWNAESTDEYNEVFEALRVCSGQLNYERWFKRFYLYILSAEYALLYIGGWLVGLYSSPLDFAAKVIRDMSPLFMIGRLTSAIMGTLTVYMTYLIGRSLFSKTVGVVAALFLCVNTVNVELSHYARVDATLCAIVLISFYYIAKIIKDDSDLVSKYYMLAGLFAGIAFQNKIPAIILIIPFMYAHLTRFNYRISLRMILNKNLLFFCSLFFGGIIIGNPAVLIAPLKFVNGVISMGQVFTTPINETKSEHIGYIVYLLYFYKELGIPLLLLAIFSIWKAIRERRSEYLILLSFIVPFYVLMGASSYMVGYSYMIPLMPFLYLLCAEGLVSLVNKLKWDQSSASKALCVALVVLLAYPIFNVGTLLLSLSGRSTRYLAKQWIEQNIVYGSKLLMDSGKTINSTAPLISQNRKSILRTIEDIEKYLEKGDLLDATKMVDRNAIKYYELLLKSVPDESYDITSTKFGLDVKSIEYYREHDFQYFVISDSMKRNRTDEFFTMRAPAIAHFYKSLDSDPRVQLIKAISPTSVNIGDTYYIYKVI